MTSRFPLLRTALGLVVSALLATSFVAAAAGPAYAGASALAKLETTGASQTV